MQTMSFLYKQTSTMYHVVSRVLYLTLIFCNFVVHPRLGCNLIHYKHFQGLLRTNLQMKFVFEVIY